MARTPKRLFGPLTVGTGLFTCYTVPASTKVVLRHIHVNNPAAGALTITLGFGPAASAELAARFWDAYSIPGKAAGVTDSARDVFVYMVLVAADTVEIQSSGSALTLIGNGDEITLG